jgi:hypothetical protein
MFGDYEFPSISDEVNGDLRIFLSIGFDEFLWSDSVLPCDSLWGVGRSDFVGLGY